MILMYAVDDVLGNARVSDIPLVEAQVVVRASNRSSTTCSFSLTFDSRLRKPNVAFASWSEETP